MMTSRKSNEPCAEGVEVFVRGMTSEVNAADVSRMMSLQQHMYVTYIKFAVISQASSGRNRPLYRQRHLSNIFRLPIPNPKP